MTGEAYGTLAAVYEWLVPELMLTPEGSVAAFSEPIGALAPGARVLDCAAGTGELAVGLALSGFEVAATDASEAMIERTRALAAAPRGRPARDRVPLGGARPRALARALRRACSASATRWRTRRAAPRGARRWRGWPPCCGPAACWC